MFLCPVPLAARRQRGGAARARPARGAEAAIRTLAYLVEVRRVDGGLDRLAWRGEGVVAQNFVVQPQVVGAQPAVVLHLPPIARRQVRTGLLVRHLAEAESQPLLEQRVLPEPKPKVAEKRRAGRRVIRVHVQRRRKRSRMARYRNDWDKGTGW